MPHFVDATEVLCCVWLVGVATTVSSLCKLFFLIPSLLCSCNTYQFFFLRVGRPLDSPSIGETTSKAPRRTTRLHSGKRVQALRFVYHYLHKLGKLLSCSQIRREHPGLIASPAAVCQAVLVGICSHPYQSAVAPTGTGCLFVCFLPFG